MNHTDLALKDIKHVQKSCTICAKKIDEINIQGLDNITRHKIKIQNFGHCGDDPLAITTSNKAIF